MAYDHMAYDHQAMTIWPTWLLLLVLTGLQGAAAGPCGTAPLFLVLVLRCWEPPRPPGVVGVQRADAG